MLRVLSGYCYVLRYMVLCLIKETSARHVGRGKNEYWVILLFLHYLYSLITIIYRVCVNLPSVFIQWYTSVYSSIQQCVIMCVFTIHNDKRLLSWLCLGLELDLDSQIME